MHLLLEYCLSDRAFLSMPYLETQDLRLALMGGIKPAHLVKVLSNFSTVSLLFFLFRLIRDLRRDTLNPQKCLAPHQYFLLHVLSVDEY